MARRSSCTLTFGLSIRAGLLAGASHESAKEKARSPDTREGLCQKVGEPARARMLLERMLFDATVCTNSFHHYAHPRVALAEVRRVLRPGGRLCILDVTADNGLLRWIDSRVRLKEPEHVKFYATSEYSRMFEEAGLRCVATKTILPPMKAHLAEK